MKDDIYVYRRLLLEVIIIALRNKILLINHFCHHLNHPIILIYSILCTFDHIQKLLIIIFTICKSLFTFAIYLQLLDTRIKMKSYDE